MRGFLWAGQSEGNVDNLVRWNLLVRRRVKGGSGIGNLRMKNVALEKMAVNIPSRRKLFVGYGHSK